MFEYDSIKPINIIDDIGMFVFKIFIVESFGEFLLLEEIRIEVVFSTELYSSFIKYFEFIEP